MTDKHDKLVEMALDAGFHAGKTISGQRYAYDGAGIDVTKELAAFADAHVASLCADVKPWVWLVTGSRVFDDQVEFTQSKAEARIAERKDGSECVPLVPASTVAAITAQRDAALARVAELEAALRTADHTFAENGILASHAARQEIQAALTKGQP